MPFTATVKNAVAVFYGGYMTIRLYKTFDQKEKLNKTLTNEKTVTGTLKTKMSIIKPSILLHNSNINFTDYNYCYIVDFDRYYFIDDIMIETANLYELKLNEDVLMSFNADIKNMTVEIMQATVFNSKKVECETTNEKTLIKTIDLQNPFNNNGFLYLTTVKGV